MSDAETSKRKLAARTRVASSKSRAAARAQSPTDAAAETSSETSTQTSSETVQPKAARKSTAASRPRRKRVSPDTPPPSAPAASPAADPSLAIPVCPDTTPALLQAPADPVVPAASAPPPPADPPVPTAVTAEAPAASPPVAHPAAPAWEPMPGTEEPPRRPDRSHWRDRFRRDRFRDREREAGGTGAPDSTSQGDEGPTVQRLEPVPGEGLLEVSGKGFGFLRDAARNFEQTPQDIFVTPELVRRYGLRDGLWIAGDVRRGPRGPQLLRITAINGEDPEKCRFLPVFEELTSLNPSEWIPLETVPDRYTTRVIDLMAPIGKGQRGLIVAPPRTGKTTLLQHIAEAVLTRHPDIVLMVLLVDERPEEVTEIRRAVPKAEIMASSNDSDLKSHTRIAQLAIERARRLVEYGRDVFLLLDSITRVARAFNNAMAHGGRTMSGGVDSRAMEIPRRLFASARNTDEAGSLTIMGTALVQTGSKADELIFQEFKGTGNMELVLDRTISDQRIYPAVDIFASGTRREELLLPIQTLEKIGVIRRGLSGHRPIEAIERLLSFLRKFPTNEQMLASIPAA